VNGLARAFDVAPDEFAGMLEAEKPTGSLAPPKRGRPRKPATEPAAGEGAAAPEAKKAGKPAQKKK
jgi:hypothetical protein